MIRSINGFFTISEQKSRHVKITCTPDNERNMYQFLRKLGYRNAKLDGKRVYFNRNGADIIPVSFRDIKDALLSVLKKFEFSNVPDNIGYSVILNWYYKRQPIKENKLFAQYLDDILTEAEAHSFRLQTDNTYKHKFEAAQLLSKFDEWTFRKTVDRVGGFGWNNPLFYKNIGPHKYLVFNHSLTKDSAQVNFDCWVATFTSEEHIGNKKPLEIEDICLSFDLGRNFHLIKKYLN